MWKLNPDERIVHWRDFRKSLEELSLEQAITQTAEFWARAPFVPYNLDPDKPNEWPDPWTLIYENTYCDIAKCLGIVYTISLTGHRTELDVEFRVYEDSKTRYRYNLAWINRGKYILNMTDGEILNNTQFDKTLKLKQKYTAEDLQLKNY